VVVGADPLREAAPHVLIGASLGEGNTCEAVCQFDSLRDLLAAGLRL
jgi:hypothetical protein